MKWEVLDSMRCKECGARVVECKMGPEEDQYMVRFECGRKVWSNPFAEGDGKEVEVECGWKRG